VFNNLKLSTKLLLTFVPIFLILVAGSYVLNNRTQENAMLEQAKVTAIQRAHIVREALVSQMVEKYKVEDSFLSRLQQVGGLQDLFIWINVDNLHFTEDLIDSARIARLTVRMNDALAKGDEGLPVFQTGNALFIQREDEMEAIVPFKAEKKCLTCHAVEIGHVLGVAHISVPLADIKAAIQSNSEQNAMITGSFALVILILAYWLFKGFVQKPVKQLLEATEAMSHGNMNFEMTLSTSNDEIGILSQSFDKMRKALKQSQDALRTSTVGQIASSLMRDFRAPLRQIVSSVDQIDKGNPPPEQKAALSELVRSSVLTMNKMAQDLLDFTSGDVKVNKMSSSISSVMGYVADAVRPDLQKDSISLEVQQGYKGNATIDYERTARALINIISYSSNYVPPGGTIRLTTEEKSGSVMIKVADNGSAIPPQFKNRIFEPFVKIVQEKGVGLSLALAKRVIEVQGGSIEVDSAEGKGNTFTIAMPLGK
jgi:signal transduction histidine kinase